jgi:hypothetical protein
VTVRIQFLIKGDTEGVASHVGIGTEKLCFLVQTAFVRDKS